MKILPLKCKKPLNKEVLKKYKDVQIIDSRFVAGREHIEFAISQAEKAFKRGENFSNDFFIEVLARASAQRQIKKAIEIFGLRNSREVILICEEFPKEILKEYECEEALLEINEEKCERIKELFGIDEKEIRTVARSGEKKKNVLKNIVKDRIALIPA
ncbi:MAG: KEOPS complex subunit Cgi121 [Methanobacteriota archaeon]